VVTRCSRAYSTLQQCRGPVLTLRTAPLQKPVGVKIYLGDIRIGASVESVPLGKRSSSTYKGNTSAPVRMLWARRWLANHIGRRDVILASLRKVTHQNHPIPTLSTNTLFNLRVLDIAESSMRGFFRSSLRRPPRTTALSRLHSAVAPNVTQVLVLQILHHHTCIHLHVDRLRNIPIRYAGKQTIAHQRHKTSSKIATISK
jgi:hypothetical protein